MSGANSPKSPSTPKGRGWAEKSKGPPIDYSFKELTRCEDILFEEPVSGQPWHPVVPRGVNASEYLDSLVPPSPSANVKQNSTSVRICNNALTTLKGLDRVMTHLLTDPQELTWLDASCNKLASIEEVVTRFPKLQVLYLHGNAISHLSDIQQLAQLKNLQKLTLHGNPLSEKGTYKMWVCSHLPGLKALDFSSITKLERDAVDVWQKAHSKQAVH